MCMYMCMYLHVSKVLVFVNVIKSLKNATWKLPVNTLVLEFLISVTCRVLIGKYYIFQLTWRNWSHLNGDLVDL